MFDIELWDLRNEC